GRTQRAASLHHVALPLAVVADRLVGPGGGRVVELQRVAALAADLVGELEAVDLLGRAHDLAVLLVATRRRVGRGDDPLRVLVARRLVRRVADDVLDDAVSLRVGVLLPDVAADSPQLAFLVAVSPPWRRAARLSSARRGVKSR